MERASRRYPDWATKAELIRRLYDYSVRGNASPDYHAES
jgi:hypothetical protein